MHADKEKQEEDARNLQLVTIPDNWQDAGKENEFLDNYWRGALEQIA